MTKIELIKCVAEKTNLTPKESAKALNAIMEVITESIKASEDVQIVGFGTFKAVDRGERTGYNPSTKEKMTYPASRVPKFVPGKSLKDAVNQ